MSIYDLAREAGVSYATVSRALNDRPGVSRRTREHVLALAAQFGYSPSPLARGLARQTTSSVGLIVPDQRDTFVIDFVRGAQAVAAKAGYGVMSWIAGNGDASVLEGLAQFARFRVDGVLVVGGSSDRDAEFEEHFGGPIVVAMRQSDVYPSIYPDHRNATARMVEHLARSGRRRIAFVSLPSGSDAARERLAGYHDAIDEIRGAIPVSVTAAGTGYKDGSDAVSGLLGLGISRPDAIFFAGDALAIGGLNALNRAGIHVPGEIAVATFGGLEATKYAVPSLTTLELSIQEAGQVAGAHLLRALTEEVPSLELPTSIVVRSSTSAR